MNDVARLASVRYNGKGEFYSFYVKGCLGIASCAITVSDFDRDGVISSDEFKDAVKHNPGINQKFLKSQLASINKQIKQFKADLPAILREAKSEYDRGEEDCGGGVFLRFIDMECHPKRDSKTIPIQISRDALYCTKILFRAKGLYTYKQVLDENASPYDKMISGVKFVYSDYSPDEEIFVEIRLPEDKYGDNDLDSGLREYLKIFDWNLNKKESINGI